MFIYNVTNKVDHNIAEAWIEWMRNEHIPEIIATGCFSHANILYLLEADDEEGKTYAIQYHTNSRQLYQDYLDQFSQEMRQKAIQKWGDKFIAFRSIMELVE